MRALLAAFGSAQAVLGADARRLMSVAGVGPQTATSIAGFKDDGRVDAQFEHAERIGARLVALADAEYPPLLREIYDPPPLLWVRGRLDPKDVYVSIVGTRKASEYGRRAAEHFGHGLAEAGVTVVSGLAYGIDIAGHRAALKGGGRTIAVLGSGVDRIYPSRHSATVRQIVEEERGAVISEFPLGTAPDASNFPRRNRIIAGMAQGTLVAEARETGGALITACMALEQNRDVWAVPSPLFSEMVGTNRLIRRGYAALVTDLDHLLGDLGATVSAAPPQTVDPPSDLSTVERTLFDALSTEPVHLDELCARTRLDAPSALVYLLNLEFRGLVRQMAGKQFFRA